MIATTARRCSPRCCLPVSASAPQDDARRAGLRAAFDRRRQRPARPGRGRALPRDPPLSLAAGDRARSASWPPPTPAHVQPRARRASATSPRRAGCARPGCSEAGPARGLGGVPRRLARQRRPRAALRRPARRGCRPRGRRGLDRRRPAAVARPAIRCRRRCDAPMARLAATRQARRRPALAAHRPGDRRRRSRRWSASSARAWRRTRTNWPRPTPITSPRPTATMPANWPDGRSQPRRGRAPG